jgi:hypothetical protein
MDKPNIELFSKHIFWDVDKSKLDLNQHAMFFIGRVLQYGFYKDWQVLLQIYGVEKIKDMVIELRYIDDISLHFASNLFSIPLEKFRCYTTKQSAATFWNY